MSPSQQTPSSRALQDEFPLEEMCRHRGRWVALSPDGGRVIASAPSLAELDSLVLAAGEKPEEVLLERVPDGAFIASGLELS